MAEIVYLDANGVEVSRKVKGKGRLPTGAYKDGDNYFVKVVAKPQTLYVTLSKDGTVTEQRVKGRGRTSPDYVEQADGQWKGHFVKQLTE